MKKKIILSLLAVFAAFLVFVGVRMGTMGAELVLTQTYALPGFSNLSNLEANARQWAVAVDGAAASCGGNQALEESCASLPTQPTASTAKMILALAVMEAQPFNLNEKGAEITITPEYYNIYAWYLNNGGSNTAVTTGEIISEYDALTSVLLASSNNLADTLATWVFGSLESYQVYATNMLKTWGITQTTVGIDACGFDDSTVSTAADLARIGTKVLENPVLAEIVGTREYIVPVAGLITNSNKNLGRNGVVGIKTGWIGTPSGYCLISGYRLGEHIITVAVLGADTRTESFESSNSLVEALQAQLTPTTLIDNTEVGYYDSWWTGRVPVMATEKIEVLAWDGENVTTELTAENFKISLETGEKTSPVQSTKEIAREPSLIQRFLHVFGWRAD